MTRLIPWDDVRVCNCARCGAMLLGERMTEEFATGNYRTTAALPAPVYSRLAGRPYCKWCDTCLVAEGLHPTPVLAKSA